jgi:hypothetical protein
VMCIVQCILAPAPGPVQDANLPDFARVSRPERKSPRLGVPAVIVERYFVNGPWGNRIGVDCNT